MKDVRAYTGGQLMLLWAGGAVLAFALLMGAFWISFANGRRVLGQVAHEDVQYHARDAKIAADWEAYAKAHPGDPAARRTVDSIHAGDAKKAKLDSAMTMLARRGAIDTTDHPGVESERGLFRTAVVGYASLAMLCTAALIPIALIVATFWWSSGAARREAH